VFDVVYFMIDDMHMNDYELFIDSSVKGFSPKGSSDVMELITKVAKRLKFDYLEARREWYELSQFGYFMSELSREKVYLVTIPENTHNYVEGRKYDLFSKENTVVDPIIDIYVDRGSPVRHFYKVYMRPNPEFSDPLRRMSLLEFEIEGISARPNTYPQFNIRIDMAPESWRPRRWRKSYERDDVLFIDLRRKVIDREMLMIIERALELNQESIVNYEKKYEGAKNAI
jgi:hypothetical protein